MSKSGNSSDKSVNTKDGVSCQVTNLNFSVPTHLKL